MGQWQTFWNWLKGLKEKTMSNGETPRSEWKDWSWPVPVMHDRMPVISDGFGATKRNGRGHFGVDIMHHRKSGDEAIEYKASDGTSSKGYVIFQGEPARAAGPGKIYKLENTATGHTVKISHRVHGRPILSVYRHLQNFHPNLKEGMIVSPTTILGLIGDNPADKDPPHLHFELWDTGLGSKYPDWNIDPARVMGEWTALTLDNEIKPYTGDKLPPPSGDAVTRAEDQKKEDAGGGSGGLGFIGLLLTGILGGGLLLRKRRSYV